MTFIYHDIKKKKLYSLASSLITFARISNLVIGSSVFAVIVTVFVCGPSCLAGLYSTFISDHSPGIIGSLGYWGTVQPQEPFADSMISGFEPEFLNSKICRLVVFCLMVPKSYFFSLKTIDERGYFGFSGLTSFLGETSLSWS